MRLSVTVAAAATLVACGDPPPDPDPVPLYPGPCEATGQANGQDMFCVMAYDAEDRLVSIDCEAPSDATDPDVRYTLTRTLAGDELSVLTWSYDSFTFGGAEHTWSFDGAITTMTDIGHDGTSISWERTAYYDTSNLVFAGHPLDPFERPVASDAITDWMQVHFNFESTPQETTTQYAYTYSPPDRPPSGTRTRTRDDGAEVVEFDYEGGRLVRGDRLNYIWEDDRLVGIVAEGVFLGISYEYDEAGNLIRRVNRGTITTYDYGCWE